MLYEATASYLKADNVTVTYGEWANYTYCEFEDKTVLGIPEILNYGKPYPYSINGVTYNSANSLRADNTYWEYVRVQGNDQYPGLEGVEHTHDTDEDCGRLLPFDQLFGTGDGQGKYAFRGGSVHEGVTVIYNNK